MSINLPTEPGFYLGANRGYWQLDHKGAWWFRGYPDSHPTPHQQDRSEFDALTFGSPFVRLVPADSLRGSSRGD